MNCGSRVSLKAFPATWAFSRSNPEIRVQPTFSERFDRWHKLTIHRKRRSRFDPVSASVTRDCQSRFNLFNGLESGFHGHSGSGDFALHVSEQIARLVPLLEGESSQA